MNMEGPVGAAVRLGAVGAVIGGVVGGKQSLDEFNRTIDLMAVGPAPTTAEEAAKIAELEAELAQHMGSKTESVAKGAVKGALGLGVILAVVGIGVSVIGQRLSSPGMSDVDNVQLKLAQIAEKALWRTMGRPGDVPWWFRGVEIAQDRDGNYFLKALIHNGLPMDDTGWPYGLPHTSEGVKVVAERENPDAMLPVKLGPTN